MILKFKITAFEESSANELSAKVRDTLTGDKKFQLKAHIGNKRIYVRPSAWRFNRSLPGELVVDGQGCIVGDVGTTALLRYYTVRIEVDNSQEALDEIARQLNAVEPAPSPPIEVTVVPESDTVRFSIKITKDSRDGSADELVGGMWQDYSHVRIKESGSSTGIQNDWKLFGMSVTHAVTGVSGSFEAIGLRTEISNQLCRLSIINQGASFSMTKIGSRDSETSVGRSHSRTTVGSDTQISRIIGDRFSMIKPARFDVEFHVMEPVKENENGLDFWDGGTNKDWKGVLDKRNWVAITAEDIGEKNFERLNTSDRFKIQWNLMSNLHKQIDELNSEIPGVGGHFPPLSKDPMSIDDLGANNSSARLVARAGFSQLFHIHSDAGRSFYFSPTTSYYLATVRFYYDELNQTIGNQKILIKGGSHHHYQCKSRSLPGDGQFACWDGGGRGDWVDGRVVSVYEGEMLMKSVRNDGGELKTVSKFSMGVEGGREGIEFQSKSFKIGSYEGDFVGGKDWPEAFWVGYKSNWPCIGLSAPGGFVDILSKEFRVSGEERVLLEAQGCEVKMSKYGFSLCSLVTHLTLNGSRVYIG